MNALTGNPVAAKEPLIQCLLRKRLAILDVTPHPMTFELQVEQRQLLWDLDARLQALGLGLN